MLLNSHISAYARCLARKVCGLVRSTWGTSLVGDTIGAREYKGSAPGVHRANIPPRIGSLSLQMPFFVLRWPARIPHSHRNHHISHEVGKGEGGV